MEWVMFAFVVAIAVKSFEMARALQAIEHRLAGLEGAHHTDASTAQAATPPRSSDSDSNSNLGRVAALEARVEQLSSQLREEARVDADRDGYSHRERVDD